MSDETAAPAHVGTERDVDTVENALGALEALTRRASATSTPTSTYSLDGAHTWICGRCRNFTTMDTTGCCSLCGWGLRPAWICHECKHENDIEWLHCRRCGAQRRM